MNPVIETRALTKRYRRVTALSEATVTVPEGAISALIGPNGAGKTTLLRLLTGLSRPTGGEVAVLGGTPRQDPAFLADVGFLAQEIPLYRRFTAADHIAIGAHLNPRWDAASAWQRLKALDIPLDQPAARCPEGSAPSWRWPSRWPNSPACCCWTSRSPRWTRWPGGTSWAPWPTR